MDNVADTVNHQKGELVALNCLLISIFRALPVSLQAQTLLDLQTERDVAKTVLLNSTAPDEVLKGLDDFFSRFEQRRRR